MTTDKTPVAEGLGTEELATWIADSPPMRVARAGKRWKALHRRGLRAINGALETCAQISLAIDSGRGNEKEIARAIRSLKHVEKGGRRLPESAAEEGEG